MSDEEDYDTYIPAEFTPSGAEQRLLSEGCWFNSPGLHVKVSLGEILDLSSTDGDGVFVSLPPFSL